MKQKSINKINESAIAVSQMYDRLKIRVEQYFNELIGMINTMKSTSTLLNGLTKQGIEANEQEIREAVKKLVNELKNFENQNDGVCNSRTDDIFIAGELKFRDILKSNKKLFEAYRKEAE